MLHVAFHGVVADVEHPEGRHAVHPVRRALAERVGLGVQVVRRVVVVDEVADVLVAPREEGVAREEVAVVNDTMPDAGASRQIAAQLLRGKDEQRMSEQNCTYRHVYSAPRGVLYDATYLN